MIVKILGRTVPISILNKKLRELWKPRGAMFVMDLPRQFFMVRFEVEDEYLAALTRGSMEGVWKLPYGASLNTEIRSLER